MNAKEAAKKTKSVRDAKRKRELDKAERERQVERVSALKQLPKELERVFAYIKKTADSGNNFSRWEIHYSAQLAYMLRDRLIKEGYEVTVWADGGYSYDGAYLGPTTQYTLNIKW